MSPALTLAVALAAGVLAQALARQLRLPGIVVLLGAGAALGPEGAGWVVPRTLGDGLFDIVDFGVAVILFEGGLNLELSRLRREEAAIRRLVTVGALVTLVGSAAAARLVLDAPWDLAILFASLIVVTGPTVVTPLLRDMRLQHRVKTVLEAEAVLIDPIGALLAAVVLQVVLLPEAASVARALQLLALGLGFGAGAGLAGGFALGGLLRIRAIASGGYSNVLVLAGVLLLFALCEAVVPHSGILAAPVAGIVVGNLGSPVDRDVREFKDQMTVLLLGLLFVLLAADISLEDIRGLGWPGAAMIAALVLVIRPASVWLATTGVGLTARERAFVAWVAPRGIVAAAVASITAATLEGQGVGGGTELQAMVFLTILGTVAVAGVTARPAASLLGLRLPRRDRVMILGAQEVALALGAELRAADQTVVFLDADPKRCRRAEEAGFPVVYGDALDERTLLRAQAELAGTAIGLTSNEHLNSLFVRQATELCGVPTGYVSVSSAFAEDAPASLQRSVVAVLFDGPHDLERWDVRLRHKGAVLERFVAGEEPPGSESDAPGRSRQERFVILAVRRNGRTQPMHAGFRLRAGDEAAVLLDSAARDEAIALLASRGLVAVGLQPDVSART